MLDSQYPFLTIALLSSTLLQGLLFAVDEFICHRRRNLGRWERLGHPVDAIFLCIPLAIAAFGRFSDWKAVLFVAFSIASCAMVTKDEWVHSRECGGLESWIHSLMFMVHPVIFIFVGLSWYLDENSFVRRGLPFVAVLVGVYQLLYWNFYHDNSDQQHVL